MITFIEVTRLSAPRGGRTVFLGSLSTGGRPGVRPRPRGVNDAVAWVRSGRAVAPRSGDLAGTRCDPCKRSAAGAIARVDRVPQNERSKRFGGLLKTPEIQFSRKYSNPGFSGCWGPQSGPNAVGDSPPQLEAGLSLEATRKLPPNLGPQI